MKTLFLLFMLMPLSLFAAEQEIEGAFGINLGDVVDIDKLEKVDNDKYGGGEYAFIPENPYDPLPKYSVFVTPTEHKVYKIEARGSFKSMKACRKELSHLEELLSKKYKNTTRMLMDDSGAMPKITFGKSIRKVTGLCAGGMFKKDLVLSYIDGNLIKQAKTAAKEKNEMKDKAVDAGSERDASGL